MPLCVANLRAADSQAKKKQVRMPISASTVIRDFAHFGAQWTAETECLQRDI